MSSLPTEVLNTIYTYLHYEQKVECMLVCRHWAHVIRTISLLHTLVLQPNDGFQDCKSLIKRLRTDAQLSNQVRRLIIFGGFNVHNDANELAEMFPQLRVLYLRQLHILKPNFTAAHQVSRWQHSLERLVERQTSVFTTALLKMGIFHHLTELSLSRGRENDQSASIFEHLKNAPALNQLELEDYDVRWQDFELLHKNVPLLATLILNSIQIPQERPMNSVEPTSNLKTLAIRYCMLAYELQFHWIRYITQKYSNLAHFTFFVIHVPDQRNVETEEYHQRLVVPLVDRLGTQLETLVLKNSLTTSNLFEALDSKGYQLKKLSIDYLYGITPELNQSLFRSHQAIHLHTLSLTGVNFKTFTQFKVFQHLKSLKLSYRHDHNQVFQEEMMVSIALNEMLSELPQQLEELTLISCAVRIEPFVSSCPSEIKSLTFEYVELDGQVSIFISDYCRRLKNLSLILCQPGLSTIYLPDHRLSCFEIFSHDTQAVFMLTINGEQSRYYKMNRVLFQGLKGIKKYFSIHDVPAFATRTATRSSINSNQPIIHLTCANLSALYINTRLAI